jgi:peptidoglycan/xylan/chitin deacetylase (PgdA/CDA1 family)
VLADHLALGTAGLLPRCRLLGANLVSLDAAARERREVALTFDDGPDPRSTPFVLEELARRGVRASFFCVGERVERWGRLAAEVAGAGHDLENHSYSHPYSFALLGPRRQACEIDRAQSAIAGVCGRSPVYFRAPAGLRNLWLQPVLAPRGLALAAWTRRGYDTVDRDPERVVGRLLVDVAPGHILLLHDGGLHLGRDALPLLRAVLPRLLDGLAEQGLHPIALPRPAASGHRR